MRLPRGTGDFAWESTLHEFGHALGLRHEQLHPDKPASCTQSQDGESLRTEDVVLTAYDPDAVMNYCALGNRTELTDQEKLFAEMVYPANTSNHRLRSRIGYEFGSGVLVTRTNSTLETDWTRRGALPAAYSEVRWLIGGSPILSTTFPVSQIGGIGVAVIDYDFVDFRGVSHTGESLTVAVSDSLHAAVTAAIL